MAGPLRPTVCSGCGARLGWHPDDDFACLAYIELKHFEDDRCGGAVYFEARVAPAPTLDWRYVMAADPTTHRIVALAPNEADALIARSRTRVVARQASQAILLPPMNERPATTSPAILARPRRR